VLDVDSGCSRVIGDRAFGTDPVTAAAGAAAFYAGMRRAGMAAVGKHFPGHGGVAEDSHLELPVDPRPLAALEARDLIPFRKLIAAGIEGLMPAHVIYREIDAAPAGYSPFWIREVLRNRLGFQGAVFSDDLSMAGAAQAGGYVDRARMALEAGGDMVLVCNAPGAAEEVLDDLSSNPADPTRTRRLEAMRGRFPIDRAALLECGDWRRAVESIAALDDPTEAP
jgi:beta-N-acetylhexosaminidase